MDEMTMVRELRADVPPPDRARLALGRDRLVEETLGVRPTRRRVGLGLAVAVAAALAVTGAVLAPQLLADDGVSRVVPASAPEQRIEGSAKQVLERIAADLEYAVPQMTVPRPEEWLYTRYYEVNGTSEEQPTLWNENWYLFGDPAMEDPGNPDDDHSARQDFEFIAQLPQDPEQVIDEALEYSGALEHALGDTRETAAFRSLAMLVGSYPAQPEGLAKIYRAMAALPGIEVQPRTVPDAVGRQAIAISLTHPDNHRTRDDTLIDPATYTYLGDLVVVTKDHWDDHYAWKKGDVVISHAVVDHALTDKEGQRP